MAAPTESCLHRSTKTCTSYRNSMGLAAAGASDETSTCHNSIQEIVDTTWAPLPYGELGRSGLPVCWIKPANTVNLIFHCNNPLIIINEK